MKCWDSSKTTTLEMSIFPFGAISRFIQEGLCKIQGLLKDFIKTLSVFKDYNFMKNTDLHDLILIYMIYYDLQVYF